MTGLAFLMFAATTAFADGDCGLSLTAANINLTWSTTLPTQQITFEVKKGKQPPCDYFVTFSRGNASDYNRRMVSGASQLRYQLYKQSSLATVLKELPDATLYTDVLTGHFEDGKNLTQNQSYYVDIPLGLATTPTLRPAGTYTDTFVMKVYKQGDTNNPEDTDNVQITTIIPKNVQLSLVNSGAGFDPNDTTQAVSFGTLTTGATQTFDMRVLSNAGYSVTFSSQNNGFLKHANASIATKVPYTLYVNSVPKNLATSATTPVVVATGSGQTTTSGVANPVQVTIGSVTDMMAGNYSDIITVTAATTE